VDERQLFSTRGRDGRHVVSDDLEAGSPSSLKALRSDGQEIWGVAIDSSDWIAGIALGPGGEIHTGGTRLRNFLRDGRLAWQVGDPADHLLYWRPVVGENGSVYAVMQSGAYREPVYRATLDAFDSAGSEQWNPDAHYHAARIPPLAEGPVLAVGINITKPMVTQNPGYWISSTGVPAGIPPATAKTNVLAGGMLYSVSERIAILDPSGKARCETSPFNSYSAPVVAKNENVYIGGETEVLAFGGNCSEQWRLQVGTEIKSVAIGDEGAVYMSGDDGTVRCIGESVNNGGLAPDGWPDENHDSRNSNSAWKPD
jgi:outer membrane protein assembly factor BamB